MQPDLIFQVKFQPDKFRSDYLRFYPIQRKSRIIEILVPLILVFITWVLLLTGILDSKLSFVPIGMAIGVGILLIFEVFTFQKFKYKLGEKARNLPIKPVNVSVYPNRIEFLSSSVKSTVFLNQVKSINTTKGTLFLRLNDKHAWPLRFSESELVGTDIATLSKLIKSLSK